MTGQEAIAYIHSYHWEQHAPGLHRIRELLALLGDPQKKLKFVHVAGTNGKGSTCAMLASVLQAAGFRVGLNTSPYIVTFHERIQVNGRMISDAELVELVERVRPAAESMQEHPTEFELLVALAMLYFLEQRCDIVVLEVGMGGALDASNCIDVPEVAVLTAMGLDHTAILGPTLRDIAQAKAGIIKSGGTVVSYGQCPEADAEFCCVCREKQAQLIETDFTRLHSQSISLQGAVFDFFPWDGLEIPLAGTYQIRNAAVAITALEALRGKGWAISDAALRDGLRTVRWPGRFEILRQKPTFLLDGAHNVHGVRAAAESLQSLFPDRKFRLILGILTDKDAGQMLDLLVPLAEEIFTITPDSPRAIEARDLCAMLESRGAKARACESVFSAVQAAFESAAPEDCICAMGSLYTSGDVRAAVLRMGAEE